MEKEKNELELQRVRVLSKGCINDKTYEIDDSFRDGDITPSGVHTTVELVKLLESNPNVKFDGIFVCGGQKKARMVRMNREKFIETFKKNNKAKSFKKALESFDRGFDYSASANLVGDDYVPLLGGPFNKQLYLHDSLRMFSLAFFAFNHDPIARAIVNITRDFTLGRGYRIDSKDKKALAYWRAFEKVNDIQGKMRNFASEISYNGEMMIWWLPDNKPYVTWQDMPGQEPAKTIIPRISFIDPSTCWEIITYPEDISRVIAYQLVFPTQYQIYTAKDQGSTVPSSKFVIQQVPAEQVDHYKINCAYNEKRGRSDLYPAFGFLKRLRDTVQYSVIAMQKVAAWGIDTTIEGSPADLQAYVDSVNSEGSIAQAGSEFIHTSKVKREYISNEGQHGGSVSAFEWCLNMICASVQIPVSYLGTHLSGGSTRASALVGTEPVTKKFESRQLVYEKALRDMWDRVQKLNGNEGAECEITFPELITQDRSQKIKDLVIANEEEVISHEYMANTIASELGYTSYDYAEEQLKIKAEKEAGIAADTRNILISPLTSKSTAPYQNNDSTMPKPSAVTSPEKKKIADNDGA